MGRPRSVAGGRPVVIQVRCSEAEAAAVDQARGSVSRSAWFRGLIPTDVGQEPEPAPVRAPREPVAATSATAQHSHKMVRVSTIMDECECGATQMHQPGVK